MTYDEKFCGKCEDHLSRTQDERSQNAYLPHLFAAIDLGTNNCRMVIASWQKNRLKIVASHNHCVRLGEGLEQNQKLNNAAMQRTLCILSSYAEILREKRISTVRAVATEACRRAANSLDFLARVRRETGLSIDIISPRVEAELAIESCRSLLQRPPIRKYRALLFDIGGGSTEVAWLRVNTHTRSHHLTGVVSVPVGVISMAEKFAPPRDGAPQAQHDAYYEAMVAHVSRYIARFEVIHQIQREIEHSCVQMLGTSGTVTTLAGVSLALKRYRRNAVDGVALEQKEAFRAINILRNARQHELDAHPCVGPERRPFVLPGCAIFDAIHRAWPTREILVADRGIREGILMQLVAEHYRPSSPLQNKKKSFPSVTISMNP